MGVWAWMKGMNGDLGCRLSCLFSRQDVAFGYQQRFLPWPARRRGVRCGKQLVAQFVPYPSWKAWGELMISHCRAAPRNYAKSAAARRRLGKIAVCFVLVGLAVAGGMAFPTAGRDAEAYTNRAGYSYTQRVCQEWGSAPRQYWVRDEMDGSDWSSSGGWAIILEGSSAVQSVGPWVQDAFIVSDSLTDGNVRQFYIGTGILWPGYRYTNSLADFTSGTLPQAKLVVDNSRGAFHGRQGLIILINAGTAYGNTVFIDQNGDGSINAADQTAGPGNNQYERLLYRARTVLYGGTYIRWADMAWCR